MQNIAVDCNKHMFIFQKILCRLVAPFRNLEGSEGGYVFLCIYIVVTINIASIIDVRYVAYIVSKKHIIYERINIYSFIPNDERMFTIYVNINICY